MAVRLYSVNGTGVQDSSQYEKDFSNSFCKRIASQFSHKTGLHHRGAQTNDMGDESQGVLSTSDLADKVVRAVESDACTVKYANCDLVFSGYSRGGAAVILAAKRLQDKGLQIAHMFLFDPVDRALNVYSTATIPRNVRNLYLLRRVPNVYSRLADQHLRNNRQALSPVERTANAANGFVRGMSTGGPPLAVAGAFSGGLTRSVTKTIDQLIADELRAAGRDEFVQSQHDDFDSIPFGNTGESCLANFTKVNVDVRAAGSHGAMGGTPWKFKFAKAYQHHEDLAVKTVERLFMPEFERVMAG